MNVILFVFLSICHKFYFLDKILSTMSVKGIVYIQNFQEKYFLLQK